jgi:arylsulfatase A-like enzyme
MSPARPNLLFITLDQWRADCLSLAGHPCLSTPHIDALAADGAFFRNHYTVASPCGPARASLLSGLYLHNHGSVRNGIPLDRRHTNVALEMAKAGYAPTLFGFTDTTLDPRDLAPEDPRLGSFACMAPGFVEGLHLPGDAWPWVNWLVERGYPRPAAARDMWLPASMPRSRVDNAPPIYPADESETRFLTDTVLDFIAHQDKPWFVHLSYFRPHHPYIVPEPFNRLFSPERVPPPLRQRDRQAEAAQHPFLAAQMERQMSGPAPVQDKLPMSLVDDEATAQLRALYYGSVAECDDAIGRIVASLKAAGQYEDTLILLTSDHGDMLGDHWLWAAEGYFDAAFHIPLIVKPVRRRRRGIVVDAFTESVDVMPTLLESAGVNVPGRCDGRSLVPFLDGEIPDAWREDVHWEFDFRDEPGEALQRRLGLERDTANLAVVRDATRKYVYFAGLPPILFDLRRDPGEFTNLAGIPGHAGAELDMARKMLDWRLASRARWAGAGSF